MSVDLATALGMTAAAQAEAVARPILVSAADVDGGGHVLAFGRMDDAQIAGPIPATDKARTAVADRIATSELAIPAAPGGELFSLHATGGGRFVIVGGGVPLAIEGVVVGALGVSATSAADDEAFVIAALTALE